MQNIKINIRTFRFESSMKCSTKNYNVKAEVYISIFTNFFLRYREIEKSE